jgi:hypothetical protein
MSVDECRVSISFKRIVVKDNGRKTATFLNEDEHTYFLTRVDGCVIKNELAADWLVTKPAVGEVIIEFKGRDVDHAVKQVHATAKYWQEHNLRIGSIAGLIVARQYPRNSTAVQRAQQAFARGFQGPLHVVTRNNDYKIEKVLSSTGPL